MSETEPTLLASEPLPVRSSEVTHVGAGVIALGMDYRIDNEDDDWSNRTQAQKAIFLRPEQREAAIDAVNACKARRKVALAGSPGTGKTWGTHACIVGELLLRDEPVLRTGKNHATLNFFRRNETTGGVDAWTARWRRPLGDVTSLVYDFRLTAVVDPHEKGIFTQAISSLSCGVIVVPSDNREKQYPNWGKSQDGKGVVLYTDPPTEAELVVICRALWNDESQRPGTPKLAGDDLDKEIVERALLVGPCPRYIISWALFDTRVRQIAEKIKETVQDTHNGALIRSYLWRTFPAESGRLQITYVDDTEKTEYVSTERSWLWRRRRRWVLNPLVSYKLAEAIPDVLNLIYEVQGGSSAGWFFERSVCEPALLHGGKMAVNNFAVESEDENKTRLSLISTTDLWLPERTLKLATTESWEVGYGAMKNLGANELLRVPTYNFPFLDFAAQLSGRRWAFYNTKNGRTTVPTMKASTGLTVLKGLGVVEGKGENMTTVKGQEDAEADVFFVLFDDVTGRPIIDVTGSAEERALFFSHITLHRLLLKPAAGTKELHGQVGRALEQFGFEFINSPGVVEMETAVEKDESGTAP